MNQTSHQNKEVFSQFLQGATESDNAFEAEFLAAIGGSAQLPASTVPAPGELIEATVLSIDKDFVFLDAGLKAEARIPTSEFGGDLETLKANDKFTVLLEMLEDFRGNPILSYAKAQKQRAIEDILQNKKLDDHVTFIALHIVKGGLIGAIIPTELVEGTEVDVTTLENFPRGFCPISQIFTVPMITPARISEYIGKSMIAKIIKMSGEGLATNIVVSRRQVQDLKISENRKNSLDQLKEGMVLSGKVKNIQNFGVFVQLDDYVDGLLHVSDVSWLGDSVKLHERFNLSDEIKVMVLNVNLEKERVALGIKQMEANPFESIAEHCPSGTVVEATTHDINQQGKGIHARVVVPCGSNGETQEVFAFLHQSEISYVKHYTDVSDLQTFTNIGQKFKAIISEVDVMRGRINLSHKSLQSNPWHKVANDLPEQSVQAAVVKDINSFGMMVGFKNTELESLVRFSDISWTRNFSSSNCPHKVGDEIKVKILKVSQEDNVLVAGIMQLEDNPYKAIMQKPEYQPGSKVSFIVEKASSAGVQGKIEGIEDITASMPLREVFRASSDTTTGSIEEKLPKGTKLDAYIVEINEGQKVISLSLDTAGDDFSSSNTTT